MLYIMRHGRTDWNAIRRLQGRSDIPLNAEGRAMAERAHNEYKDVHFDLCFCSPLIRARETAEILLRGRGVPVQYDDRLMEMYFGDYEGVEKEYLEPDCPISVIFRDPKNYTASIGGAETFDELFARTGEFLEEKVMPLLRAGKDVLIVGHGAMNSSIVCQVRGLGYADFWKEGIENCKLKRLI